MFYSLFFTVHAGCSEQKELSSMASCSGVLNRFLFQELTLTLGYFDHFYATLQILAMLNFQFFFNTNPTLHV